MNDILSQDEVDALLCGVQAGRIHTDTANEKLLSNIQTYDLTSQERIIRGRMPGLEISNERFARLFRNSISALVSRLVDITTQKIEVTKFGEFMKTVPFPSSINILKMDPLEGYALFIIEAPLLFGLVEFFFGSASAQCVKSEGRSFTGIEQRIIKKVVTLALRDMANAWGGLVELVPEHVSSEMNPQVVTIVTPSEMVINIEMKIEIGDFAGKMFLCVPHYTLDPLKEKLYSGIQSDKFEIDQRWAAWLRQLLLEAHVEVAVELGRVELCCREIMNLAVGDVITLGKCLNDDLCIRVEGFRKFTGVPSNSRGNKAVIVTTIQ